MTKLISHICVNDITTNSEAHTFIKSLLTSTDFVRIDVNFIECEMDYIKQNIDYVFRKDRPEAEKGLKQVASPHRWPNKDKKNYDQIHSVTVEFRTYHESSFTPDRRIAISLNKLANYKLRKVESESDTASTRQSSVYRSFHSNRKMFLISAVRFELRNRMIDRYAEMGARIEKEKLYDDFIFENPLLPNDYPAAPLPELKDSMEYARMWDKKAQGVLKYPT